MNKSSWKVWCFYISNFFDQLFFCWLYSSEAFDRARSDIWLNPITDFWLSGRAIWILSTIYWNISDKAEAVLRINVLNTAHFCILCVLNILCHISCWGSTWKFHVLMLDCGRIWHLWQDVAGATCPASTCCCLQSDRKPGLNYVTEWPTLVFLWN